MGRDDFALEPLVRDPTKYIWEAWNRETAREIELAEESLEYLCSQARERQRKQKENRRRVRWTPPPPHRLNDVEARRYRTIVLAMLRADARQLPTVLFGVLEAFLGDHTPGENDPAPAPAPAPASAITYAPRWRYDDDDYDDDYDNYY